MMKSTTTTMSIALCTLLAIGLATVPVHAKPRAAPLPVQEVEVDTRGHAYRLVVLLGETLPWMATLDTGATDLILPFEAYETLWRMGAIVKEDHLPPAVYRLADGRELSHHRVLVTLTLGPYRLANLEAAIGQRGATLLLGKSVLTRFQSFGIDHTRSILRLGQPR